MSDDAVAAVLQEVDRALQEVARLWAEERAEYDRLRARVAELEAAINPLASLPLWPEEFAAMGDRDLTIGEIRAARAALKDTTHEPSA